MKRYITRNIYMIKNRHLSVVGSRLNHLISAARPKAVTSLSFDTLTYEERNPEPVMLSMATPNQGLYAPCL